MKEEEKVFKKVIHLEPGDRLVLPGSRDFVLCTDRYSHRTLSFKKERRFSSRNSKVAIEYVSLSRFLKRKKPKFIMLEKWYSVMIYENGHKKNCRDICCMAIDTNLLKDYSKYRKASKGLFI